MVNIIVEISKYLLIILIALYTLHCFTVLTKRSEEKQQKIFRRQNRIMYLMHFVAYVVITIKTDNIAVIVFYAAQLVFFIVVINAYQAFYPKVSRLVVNNMCMLLCIGFIILTRLDFEKSVRQFFIVVAAMVATMFIPLIIHKLLILDRLTYVYAAVGILALGAVAARSVVVYGAKLSFTVAGITIQPSEFVKIIFVFFVAAMLTKSTSFKQVVITTAIAAAHVLILVVSKDLGAALIYFVVYLIMLYVATRNNFYLFGGLAAGSVASVLAYKLFDHVQVRVAIWQDPFGTYRKGGYQVAQALFAIGTGGWFGMGLCQGSPNKVPVVLKDFIFAAVVEEMGAIYGLCLILICLSCFVMFLNIAMQIRSRFYKLIALGLGISYIFQVFLTIGGVTKFIPLTGVTLPLVSYGGSSVMSTLIVFAIIQGLYILREDEDEKIEQQRLKQQKKSKRRAKKEAGGTGKTEGAKAGGRDRARYAEQESGGKSPAKLRAEAARKKPRKGGKRLRSSNKEFARILYLFVSLFIVLMGYIVYFDAVKSSDLINSPYNSRQDTFADRVQRGQILASDGTALAKTVKDKSGKEVRSYPFGDLYAHVVGYASNGKAGIESIANYQMLTSNTYYMEKVANEFKQQKNIGDNVVTTLNPTLQKAAYNALGGNKGAVVVLEPASGKVLAMVSKPAFDPNTLAASWEQLSKNEDGDSRLMNRASQGLYAPGSTFKIVTALAYMEQKADYEDFSFQCRGRYTEYDHTIRCYNGSVHGSLDFAKAFAKSCNGAFAHMGLELSSSGYRERAEKLLFNKKLPFDLPSSKSQFRVDKTTSAAEKMQTGIGQGKTLVSPLHMALITSAIANDGRLMEPYVIDRIQNYNKELVKQHKPELYGELMSPGQARVLRSLMRGVVENGTGRKLNGRGYTAAGKTGTAEYSSDKNKTHSWFTGYAEKSGKKIVVTVIGEGAGSGSEVAVPIARQVFDAYFK